MEERIISAPNVAIVTDSVADLSPQVAEEFGIIVVPLVVRFGTDLYRDGLDLSPDQFYEKLKISKVLPATSVPPPAAFADTYDKLAEKGKRDRGYQFNFQTQCHLSGGVTSRGVDEEAMACRGPEFAIGGYGTGIHSNCCCQSGAKWG